MLLGHLVNTSLASRPQPHCRRRRPRRVDRKSTRLNSSHLGISYAVFCLKKKKKRHTPNPLCTAPTKASTADAPRPLSKGAGNNEEHDRLRTPPTTATRRAMAGETITTSR